METAAMDHNHAIKTQAAVRYILKEMREEECSAYEEHYIGCRECSDEVTTGFGVAEAIRQVARTMPAPVARPSILQSIVASFRLPAPALSLALLLCTAGLSVYQASVVSRLKEPQPEMRSVLTGIAHGAGAGNVIQALPSSKLTLSVDYTPDGRYVAYRTQIVSASGRVEYTVPLPAKQAGYTASVVLPAEALDAGVYSMVVLGRTSDGAESEVGRGTFELQFTDRK